MKLNKIISFSILSAGILFSSCKKDFLDLNPYDQVPTDQAITDEGGMQAAANGIYSALRATNLYGRQLPFFGDILADNVFISTTNSNRYIAQFNYTYTNANAEATGTWVSAYGAILRANNVINANLTNSANVNQLKGEALTLRALLYWNLVVYYAKPYTVDPNAEGVPLVLTYDAFLKPARSKVSEVYTQIIKDLNDAYGLLNASKNSSYVTKFVARALQARVALFMGDYAGAKTAALDVVTNGGYTMTTAANLFNYWKNPVPTGLKVETIFEVSSDVVNNNGSNALPYFYDQAGYGDAISSDDLYSKFAATDARINLFLSGVRANQNVKIVNKFPNTTNSSEKDDTKVLRYTEVLLTLAEAYYRTNDETNAKVYLNMVAKQRDPSFAGYASTGTQLLDDIILERRKELAFEGMRYPDLLRLNRDVTRVNINNNYVGITPLTLPVTNFRRVQPIPQQETDANPNISQNPGY